MNMYQLEMRLRHGGTFTHRVTHKHEADQMIQVLIGPNPGWATAVDSSGVKRAVNLRDVVAYELHPPRST